MKRPRIPWVPLAPHGVFILDSTLVLLIRIAEANGLNRSRNAGSDSPIPASGSWDQVGPMVRRKSEGRRPWC